MIVALILAQSMNLNNQPLLCMDEGSYCRADRLRAFEINCSGAGISCAQTGGRMTVTVSGGGGGSTPTVTCGAGEALSWNGATWLCVSTVSTASALASDPTACSAGQYVTDISAAGALTCSTPPGTYTLPDSTSVTTGGLRLTGDLGGTATSPSVVDDSHSHTVSTISATGTPSATTYLRGDGTWATVSGGGGSPGGSTTQVQYNNAGAFGGISQVETDGTQLIFVGTTTHATAPAATKGILTAFQHYGANAPAMLQLTTPEFGVDMHYSPAPFTRSDDSWWGCVLPGASGSATYTPTGRAVAGSATGTAAAVAWAATDARTRQVWVQHPAAATANTNAGYRANVDYMWRGNAAGLGGFLWAGAFALPLVTATTRVFVGLKDATAVLTATADPNAALDTVYFGCNAADSNLSICSNNNSGTATCTTLGASFPCHTNNAAYDVAFWASPNASSIGYWIRHLTAGTEATGSLTTDLPRNTVALGWDFNVNTGSTASAVQIHVGGSCWYADP